MQNNAVAVTKMKIAPNLWNFVEI